jgi:hypothetical protein
MSALVGASVLDILQATSEQNAVEARKLEIIPPTLSRL